MFHEIWNDLKEAIKLYVCLVEKGEVNFILVEQIGGEDIGYYWQVNIYLKSMVQYEVNLCKKMGFIWLLCYLAYYFQEWSSIAVMSFVFA